MASSKKTDLSWRHVGPESAAAIEPPPAPVRVTEYVLAFDETRKQLVYAISPEYHQFGHAWAWTGKKWEQIASTTYRLGSAGPWSGAYDPVHGAIVGWSFDSEHPVGVVIGKKCTVIAEAAAFTDYSDDPFTKFEVSGEAPRPVDEASWDDATGVFAVDPQRRVTVCLTPAGVFELEGKTWKKAFAAPEGLLPSSVRGERDGGGAVGVYDVARKAVVFALFDNDDDELKLFTWDGAKLAALAAKGLPKDLSDFSSHFAMGSNGAGLVILAKGALHALGPKGFTATKVEGPPKLQAGVLGGDGSGRTVLGPHEAGYTEQRAFLFFGEGKTERHGAVRVKSPLSGMSKYRVVHTGSSVLAVGIYFQTYEWTPEHGWEERLSSKKGDELRDDATAQALVFAWGAPHAIMSDGRVFRFDKGKWKAVLGTKPKGWAERVDPAIAFDEAQQVIVTFGGIVKSKETLDTLVFDGKEWLDAEPGPKPKDDKKEADFVLAWDGAARAVVRIGLTEIAHFRSTWEPTPRKDLAKFRGAMHHHALVLSDRNGRVVCVQPDSGLVTELGTKVRELGRFDRPRERTDSHTEHFVDDAVIDEKNRLLAFMNDDVTASWVLELPE